MEGGREIQIDSEGEKERGRCTNKEMDSIGA